MRIMLSFIIGVLLCGCQFNDNDEKFIERKTKIVLEGYGKQIYREQSDFYLKVKYDIDNIQKFVSKNESIMIDCNSSYKRLSHNDFVSDRSVCFGLENVNNWSGYLNKDSSWCYIEVWYKDLSGD